MFIDMRIIYCRLCSKGYTKEDKDIVIDFYNWYFNDGSISN